MAAIASLLCGLFTLWPFITHGGIPSYQHDWSWPFQRERFQDGFLQLVSTWSEEGIGHANPFANANPVALFTLCLGTILPSRLALLLLLAIICLIGGTGIALLARHASGSTPGALLAVFVYICSPVFFNKTSAGQVAYLEAYALFPWVVYATIRAAAGDGRIWLALAGLSSALECVQPQFFIYGILQAGIFAIVFWRRSGVLAFATVALAEGLLNLSGIYAALALRQGYGITILPPTPRYELLQSAAPTDAVRMLGYIIPYAVEAYGRFPFGALCSLALWAVPLVALVGFVLMRSKPAVRGGLVLALVGVVLSTGERGPLAPLLQWGFANASVVTLFREFYHSSVLTACGMSIGTACAIGSVPRVAFAISGLYFAAFIPLVVTGHNFDLHFHKPPDSQLLVANVIRSLPAGRVLVYPYKMPLSYRDSLASGVDTFSYIDRHHMLASEYGETPEIDAAATMLADGRAGEARGLLTRYGVRYIMWRSWVKSAFPAALLQPEQRRYRERAQRVFNGSKPLYAALAEQRRCIADTCFGILHGSRPLVEAISARGRQSGSWSNVSEKLTIVSELPGQQIRFYAAHLSPAGGWVPASIWLWAHPAWAQLIAPLAVIDRGRDEPMVLLNRRPASYAYTGGPLEICMPECRSLPHALHVRKFSGGHGTLKPFGASGLSEYLPDAALPRLSQADVKFTYDLPWRVSGTVHGGGDVLMVLRTRYDRGWVLHGFRTLRRLTIDGTLNGWLIDAGTHGGTFALIYEPERIFLIAALIQAILYGVVIVGVFIYPVHRRGS